MLIEDEPPILHMVKGMIESSPQGFIVSHTAFNGRKALHLLEESEEKPDLIMTDIRMPIMDGLQFMKELAARGYDIPCMVLSGYSDFNYAREALQSNAYDYLLKPIKTDHLEQSLAKASALLCKQKRTAERAFFKRMLRLPYDTNALTADPGFASYQLLLLRIGPHRNEEWEELSPSTGGWRQEEEDLLMHLLSSLGDDLQVWWLNGPTLNEKIAIMGEVKQGAGQISNREAEQLLAQWKRSEGSTLYQRCIAVSKPLSPDQMASSLRQLRKALWCEASIGESLVWIDEGFGSGRQDRGMTQEMDQACLTIAMSQDFHTFEQRITSWKEEWRKKRLGQFMIEHLLNTVVQHFRTQRPVEYAGTDAVFDVNELISGCKTLDEVAKQFCSFMKEEYKRLPESSQDRSAKDLIDNVKRYLEEHYMEPIRSDTLQEVFGYHKTYISNVFSDVVGVPPGKYLSKLRIDKAKQLLQERPEWSLRQVAEQVGYEDSLYFSKVFKNATGLSPKMYKERRERCGTKETS